MDGICDSTTNKGMRLRLPDVLLLAAAMLTVSAWCAPVRAQAKLAHVGVLTVDAAKHDSPEGKWLEPFRLKLAEQGWVEGRSVSFEYRDAGGDPAGFARAAAELVRLQVDVIFAASAPAVRAAHEATTTIPIVGLDYTTDPVAAGYVERHGRPGGNLTGVFLDAPGFAGKWLELLKAIVPGLSRVAVLWDPSPGSVHRQSVESVAHILGIQLQVLRVRKPDEIDTAFSSLHEHTQALVILPSPMMYVQNELLAQRAMKRRLPATSMSGGFAEAGGLLGYGPDLGSTYERCAGLVGKILRGAKPAALPIESPQRFDLVVNLKSAKALGLSVPDSVLAGATAVVR